VLDRPAMLLQLGRRGVAAEVPAHVRADGLLHAMDLVNACWIQRGTGFEA
jgi:hypothetical protein